MKRITGALTFIALISLFCESKGQGQRQNSDSLTAKKLNEYLTSANDAHRFNGVALVIQNGDILLNIGYGFSNMSTKKPNTPETRFPILSITKTFTATVILKLQDEGKLSVDDNLLKYFPDYPNGSKIKISHLLTHSSGIYDFTGEVGVEDSALINHPITKSKI